MDKYIKITPQKKKPPDDTNIHLDRIDHLRRCLAENKNVFIYGACGTGKTYIREQCMDVGNSIELSVDLLRSKSIFSELIKNSDKHLFIEDYEPESLILKSAIERVSDGERITDGSLVVVSTHMCMYPNFEMLCVPRHTPEQMIPLDRARYDEASARRSRGNIRDYFHYLDGCDDKDVFETPKDIVTRLLCESDYAFTAQKLCEHGHMWSIFQENYLDCKDADHWRIASSFSDADIVDTAIYSSDCDWNLMPYFANLAMLLPRAYMRTPLQKENIRPGACWTKHGNYKMRLRKLKDIKLRNNQISIQALGLLQKYAGFGYVEKLLCYNLTPQDFDTINHLCITSKLKARDVNSIKKKLKQHHAG